MTSRRAFTRTATDISLLPPQAQSFGSTEQTIASDYTHSSGAQLDCARAPSGLVHVVPYLTPHKVSVLILIEYFCRRQCPPESAQNLQRLLIQCIQDPEEYLHSSLDGFGSRVNSEAGPDCWRHLRTTLKRIKSPHHLSDFLLSKLELDYQDANGGRSRRVGLAGLVVSRESDGIHSEIGVDPASIVGLYIRKAQIEYRKLLFEDMCKFYTAFESYVSVLDQNNRPPHSKEKIITTAAESTIMSVFDVEKYLDFQSDQLSNPSQAEIPKNLLTHVFNIQSRLPSLAKTHYIMSLHAQQTGDFEVAIHCLHRFFDYCHSRPGRALHQYALLNLAMLHARFSQYNQALVALRECIEVAQDNSDDDCLSYALNWLRQLTKTLPGQSLDDSEVQVLADSIRPRDSQPFQYLHALRELTVAKRMQGESTPKALEALVKASSISLRHSLDNVGGIVQLLQSKIWSAYGTSSLSSMYSQLQLHYRPSESDMGDAASGYAKYASDLALVGKFEEALRVIELTKKKFPRQSLNASPWIQILVQILQRRAMSSNRLRDAQLLTHQLRTTLVNASTMTSKSHPSLLKGESGHAVASLAESELDSTNLEIQLDILLQQSLLSVLADRRLAGLEQLLEGSLIVRKHQWPETQKFEVMYLLSLAEIYMESDTAISAMPLLLKAMSLSEKNLQRPLLLLVKLRLADLLLHLDSVQHAIALLNSIMTTVLNQGDRFVQALAFLQYAKCLLAQANSTHELQAPRSVREKSLRRVITLLDRALEDCLKDVAQVLYLKVQVYHDLALDDDMERALDSFVTVNEKLTQARNREEPSWYSYYYARDACDGILRTGNNNSEATHPVEEPPQRAHFQTQIELLRQGRGLERTGSGRLGGLKRTPSQLWQSSVAPSPPPQPSMILSPHNEVSHEEEEQDGEGNDSDMGSDMDLDMDDEESSNVTKKRRINTIHQFRS
ncbi:Anaphase-promoting complex subunit 5 [Haplosporangium sp. Z 767]|nr:Anaphase-promoting complex subunit 5 [Haplosporangium sp. Z 767]